MSKELTLWIARDKDSDTELWLFTDKPVLTNKLFASIEGDCMFLDKSLFPQVTYKNSPKKCKLIIEE